MPLTAKTGQKKEPRKWLSFYQLVAFRQLFLSFFNLPLQKAYLIDYQLFK